ncbi:MAG: YggS family pyridoxal phosphate-dependent enzyme [Candidatus Diapherotrites archaeon]|uniref:Pyridoxal phosphate homeostasis protein n=1 Tax=Candidatus Iainarchaeum sp. TaxID=3101447 RepID=A0A7J4J0Z5_9ARCH|nr:MAG: hypothetical protein QT03_C0001G1326 [archaeon GW2011_AR10]MBS3059045.1 YggS family pyridoxal phosphate-dependent enzyme [Candidatus Diapherotrites archaeon]HIH08886.1 YggS family pyridoxal phosphate-dependent enzyme [Candidatus Diapherotrites archaeon]
MDIVDNLKKIREKIAGAAERSGRKPSNVKLLIASKYLTAEQANQLVSFGQKVFGENKVQELVKKAEKVKGAEWHLIGHLQSNKAMEAVQSCEVIHSVDSHKLLRKIQLAAHGLDKQQKVFLQVNVSGEASKNGLKPGELASFLDTYKQLPFGNVRIVGLMTMAPFSENKEDSRLYFKKLADLAEEFRLPELSMGMSNDFEVAIEEGATIVRIGKAITE